MKHLKILLFLLLISTGGTHVAHPESGVSMTLSEAVCRMLEFEPELNAAEYDTLSKIGDYHIARSELRPKVTVSGSAGFVDRFQNNAALPNAAAQPLLQRQIGVSLRQLLYDGGLSQNNADSALNAQLAQQLAEKSMIESRVVDLSEVYLEVMRARRQIALAQRNVENHVAMRDMLMERAMAGGSRADVGLVQGRLQLAVNTLATQRLALDLAETRFERLVGVLPGDLTYPKIPTLPDSWESVAICRNYDILAAREGLEAAEHRYLAAKARKMPRIYFDAGASAAENTLGIPGTNNSVSAASALIVGSWDIFAGGRNRGFECREHFQVGKFEELVRAAELQAQYRLKTLWQEREGSSNSLEALSRYSEELSQVNSDYEEQFRIGRQELLNILDIQQEYYSANSRLLDAGFDKDESTYRIMGVQGILTRALIGESGMDKHCSKNPCENNSCHPHNRVPVTQPCLMKGKFDGEGPVADVTPSTRQAYYVEKQQMPVECDTEGKCGSCKTSRQIGFEKSREPLGVKLKNIFHKGSGAGNSRQTSLRATPVQ